MVARKYLTGVELRPRTIAADDAVIPGFEIRLRWIDLTRPNVSTSGEPFVADEESLLSMIERLREQIARSRRIRNEHRRATEPSLGR